MPNKKQYILDLGQKGLSDNTTLAPRRIMLINGSLSEIPKIFEAMQFKKLVIEFYTNLFKDPGPMLNYKEYLSSHLDTKHTSSSFLRSHFGKSPSWINLDFLLNEPGSFKGIYQISKAALERDKSPNCISKGKFCQIFRCPQQQSDLAL